MSNTIKIKHGYLPPSSEILSEYELGFSESDDGLYIKKDNEIIKINDLSEVNEYIEKEKTRITYGESEPVGVPEYGEGAIYFQIGEE